MGQSDGVRGTIRKERPCGDVIDLALLRAGIVPQGFEGGVSVEVISLHQQADRHARFSAVRQGCGEIDLSATQLPDLFCTGKPGLYAGNHLLRVDRFDKVANRPVFRGLSYMQQTARRRVLIVDDDRLILATLSKGLKQAGCETVQGASGEEALRLVAEHVPDLAVLSLIGNKRQTCSCGGSSDRTSSSPVPVPCPEINSNPAGRVTNHVEPSLRKRYAGAGVYLFLDKTMEFHKVREALAASDGEHLERHRMMGLADAGVLEPRHPGASPSPFSSAATTW